MARSGTRSISKMAVWILMGLLILGLGGFGITNLGGNVQRVGQVGEIDLRVATYARLLQNEIRAREAGRGEPMTFAEADAAGADEAALAQMVNAAALDDEIRRMGLSIGDTNLREEILNVDAFRGIDGEFDREAYRFALQNAGLSEAEFEDSIRREATRALLQGATAAGITMPEAYVETIVTWLGERRDITWAALGRGDLISGLPEPAEADLRAYHQSHLPDFTTPETRRISYAWLTPEMLLDDMTIEESALREAYEARADQFSQPERRLVERLVMPDTQAARDAMERLKGGDSFKALVAARDLTLSDIDMGDVTRADLGEAADKVFAAATGDVVRAPSPLGPALYRVNGVLAAQTTPFEEAREELRAELAAERAARAVDARIEEVENLLAAGATVGDVAKETDLETGQIAWHPGLRNGIAAYPGFREVAAQLTADDYPQVEDLGEAGIFVARLDGIEEPQIQRLEEVRAQVLRGWRRQATLTALREQAAPQIAALRRGAGFAEQGLGTDTAEGLTRRDALPDAPASFVETVFDMDEGAVGTLEGDGRLYILRVDAVRPPAPDDPDLAELRRQMRDRAASGLAQDMLAALGADIRSRVEVQIDQAALNAVHANFN